MADAVGSYCCSCCGLVYPVEGSLDDTFCPECGADRGSQELVLCALCSMPMVPLWGHAMPTGCGGRSPLPIVGMYTDRGRISKVTSGGGEILRRVDSRRPTVFCMLEDLMVVASAGPLRGERLSALHRKPPGRKGG